MEDLPTLRLIIEKGPRKGETLDCWPSGGAARVGRVAKGNALAVRDRGVSQRHLAFEFLREISRWAVSDLDTSNGTIVNGGGPISPSVPFPLSHGDTVKIGEATSIRVEILGERNNLGVGEEEGEKERPRGRRRRAAPPQVEPVVVEESCGATESASSGGRAKGRSKQTVALDRVVKRDESLATLAEEVTRGRRPATRSTTAKFSKEDEKVEISDFKKEEILEIVVEEPKNDVAKGRRRQRKPAARQTTSKLSKVAEQVEKPICTVQISDSEAGVAFERGNSKMDTEGEGANAKDISGIEEEEIIVEERVNMDKMTLREWFDRMEKFLPQMINDIGEEIITSLKEKAQRLNEAIVASSKES